MRGIDSNLSYVSLLCIFELNTSDFQQLVYVWFSLSNYLFIRIFNMWSKIFDGEIHTKVVNEIIIVRESLIMASFSKAI